MFSGISGENPWQTIILKCFDFTVDIVPLILALHISEDEGRPHELNDAVQLSASVMVKFDDKSTDSDYHATIVSGGVRLITRDGFKANNSDTHPAKQVLHYKRRRPVAGCSMAGK